VRRVLEREGLRLRPLPRPGRSVRKPFPDWVEYRPGSIWIYDTTHFTRAGVAATVIEDLVSRKWLAEIVSAEETSTQVQIVFTDALEREACWSGWPPATTAWPTPPWTIRPGRCCWP
jgi:putative transposase